MNSHLNNTKVTGIHPFFYREDRGPRGPSNGSIRAPLIPPGRVFPIRTRKQESTHHAPLVGV
jgi:hypothetical protein